MKLRIFLKSPFILALLLGVLYLILYTANDILSELTGIIMVILGISILVIINYGQKDSFKNLIINHIKFIVTFSCLSFIVKFVVDEDFEEAILLFVSELVWFLILSLIINLIIYMKKGHWIAIGALSILTVSFFLFAFVQRISYERLKKLSLEYYKVANDRISKLESRIKSSDIQIDSLNNVIKSLKTK